MNQTAYRSILLITLFLTAPFAAMAQNPNAVPLNSVLTHIRTLLAVVIQILIVSAFVVFGWGMVRLIFTARSGDAKKIQESKHVIVWGVVGIFVLASLYGILFFIKTYIGIPDDPIIKTPRFDSGSFSSGLQ